MSDKITVVLTGEAADDLQHLNGRTGLSKTAVVNRAISLYKFVQDEIGNGSELLLQRPAGREREGTERLPT